MIKKWTEDLNRILPKKTHKWTTSTRKGIQHH